MLFYFFDNDCFCLVILFFCIKFSNKLFINELVKIVKIYWIVWVIIGRIRNFLWGVGICILNIYVRIVVIEDLSIIIGKIFKGFFVVNGIVFFVICVEFKIKFISFVLCLFVLKYFLKNNVVKFVIKGGVM